MGHAVYRNWCGVCVRDWCGVCVRARSKGWDCSRDKGKEGKLPEYVWDYFSQEMSLDISGQY
eukprot:2612729-Karenia_brevis.AAC.1